MNVPETIELIIWSNFSITVQELIWNKKKYNIYMPKSNIKRSVRTKFYNWICRHIYDIMVWNINDQKCKNIYQCIIYWNMLVGDNNFCYLLPGKKLTTAAPNKMWERYFI